jgi:hypothetical protein
MMLDGKLGCRDAYKLIQNTPGKYWLHQLITLYFTIISFTNSHI